MQKQTGASGGGDAVDMEEEHAHQQPCAGAGRVQGSVQEVSEAGKWPQTALGLAR
jgi:hypothetical protein